MPAIGLINKKSRLYSTPNSKIFVTIDLKNINPNDIEIQNYEPDGFVKVEMLAPIKL